MSLYSIEEAARYSMNVGVGAEIGRIGGGTTSLDSPAGTTGFSPRFIFGISRLNFLGLGHTVGLQTLVSTLEQRALISYLAPQFEGNPNLSLQFSGLFDISHDIRTFSAQREEGFRAVGPETDARPIRSSTVSPFARSNILGTPLISPELIPLLSQPVRVGFVSMSIIQDRRDDPVDPHRGIYNSIDLALASKASVLADRVRPSACAQLHLLSAHQESGLGPLHRLSASSNATPDYPRSPCRSVSSPAEPFSNRAFPDFQAGPRDLHHRLPHRRQCSARQLPWSLRFPLIGDNMGGVLFNDIGNVYSTLEQHQPALPPA